MDRSLLSAVSGIDANQTWLDVIGNNIANANTTGYKQDNVTFDSLLSQEIEGATAPNGVGLGGANGVSVGTGVKTAAITPDESQGTLQQTNDPTDVFINGNGYLVAMVQGTPLYTRDGTLMFDSNGNLVSPNGGLVQGWEAGNNGTPGQIDTTLPIGNITIPVGLAVASKQTQNVNLGGNLPADPSVGQTETVTGTVYDQQGNAQTLALTFTAQPPTVVVGGANDTITFKVNGTSYTATIANTTYTSDATLESAIQSAMNAAGSPATFVVTGSGGSFTITDTSASPNNTFEVTGGSALGTLNMAVMAAPAGSTTGGTSTNTWSIAGNVSGNQIVDPATSDIVFNGSGSIASLTVNGIAQATNGSGTYQVSVAPTSPDSAGGTFSPFDINFPAAASGTDNVTQYAGQDSLQMLSQDGYQSGSLASLSVGQTGIITGSFTNGQNQQLGQLALANFANPTGLSQVGNNMWEGTANSGIALVGTPGTGGRGTLTGGALEASNVDMSQQLTNLVVAQTSYQANTRVVTSNATVLNSLIQMG